MTDMPPPDEPAPQTEPTLTSKSTELTGAVGEGRAGPAPSISAARESVPTLYRDTAFWGMTATQFLGAFNDNLFKQLLLLLSVAATGGAAATVFEHSAAGPQRGEDVQWIAMFVFALPFVLFSGLAGFISDRTSKRRVIVLSKLAEIVVMLLGMAAFAAYGWIGMPGLFIVLFLMGNQSTFFGPAKYGILPELLRHRDLPRANGIFLMTTFVAIILGVAAAGLLKYLFEDRLWLASLLCVLIAVLGSLTSLAVPRLPAASPGLRFELSTLSLHPDIRRLLRNDRPLLAALLVSCMFWLVGGIVQPAVNALGKLQFELGDLWTSLMNAGIALGIAVGCLWAGQLSHGRFNGRLVRVGAWGLVACLVLLALPGLGRSQLLGPLGSSPVLVALGFFAGLFVVPIQVYLQSKPPKDEKGRMIAAMNLFNWIAILTSALLYSVFGWCINKMGAPSSIMFGFTALLILPVAYMYRPCDEQLGKGPQ